MIEAVNSSLASTQVLRRSAEQLGARDASSVHDVVPTVPMAPDGAPEPLKAPYVSPYISIDLDSNKAILQIRDSDTGEVEQQFPTKSRLAQLAQLQEKLESTDKTGISDRSGELSSYSVDVIDSNVSGASSIIAVQDVMSSEVSNTSLPSPEVAVAALSAGAQSTLQPPLSAGISVLA